MVAEHGAKDVAVVVQGKLGAGDRLEEGGVVAQRKPPEMNFRYGPDFKPPKHGAA